MKKMNWIKMGFKVFQIIILFLIIFILQNNNYNKGYIKSESFNFNASLGFTARATKEEEEEPVVEPEPEPEPIVERYTGDLTGYAADCPLCNGTLSCLPSYNVYKNNVVTFDDRVYGTVRIVASSKKLKCGSIIKFNLSSISNNSVYAIVLDRGVLNRDIDLLMPTEQDASNIVGRRKTTYEVLRNGW